MFTATITAENDTIATDDVAAPRRLTRAAVTTDSIASDLAPGEPVLEWMIARPAGTAGTRWGTAAAFPTENLFVGVTDGRLVGWSRSGLTGRPLHVKVSLPLDTLADIAVDGDGRICTVHVHCTDGSTASFGADRTESRADSFVAVVSDCLAAIRQERSALR